jgi:anaerobic nitric oxide reductase transcription regulator
VISRAALKARARQMDKNIVAIESNDCGSLTLSSNGRSSPINPPILVKSEITTTNLRDETDRFQRNLIRQTLTQENGNWAAAARKLSTDRANLNRIAKRLNIQVVKSVIEN